MSKRQINRYHVIRNVLEGRMTQLQAAKVLRRSNRQIRRLCARVERQGPRGLIHGLKGRSSNHQLDSELLGKALSAIHDPLWEGFGPTFNRDKLEDFYGIVLADETVRRWMVRTDLWKVSRRGARHRAWRPRRPCTGMLVQLDGSDHDWFEGRGPRCVLLAYIDDATSKLSWGEFVKVEDTLTLLRSTWSYLKRWGRPVAFYVDRDSIYKVNKGSEGLLEQRITQFTRAMEELGIEVIHAYSPQAKGRVERTFATHQDRLVKELRLRGISDMAEANRFLWNDYLPEHNGRFAVAAADGADAHRPLLTIHKLERILSVRHERTVFNDYTLSFRPGYLQILKHQPVRVSPGDKVDVEQRLDGTRHLLFKGVYLNFKQISKRPYRPLLVAQPSRTKQYHDLRIKGVGSKPGKGHPWVKMGYFSKGAYRVALPADQVEGL